MIDYAMYEFTTLGKTTESVHCTITGPCLCMRHRPSASTLQHATLTDSEHLPNTSPKRCVSLRAWV